MASLADLHFLDPDNLPDRVQMEMCLLDLHVSPEVIDWFFWRLDLTRDEVPALRARLPAPALSVQIPLHQGLFHPK